MVQLRVIQEAADDLDFDVEGTWDDVWQAQYAPESDLEDLEEGNLVAMEDRNDLAKDWPGRKVFVGIGYGDDVWIFDEHGVFIDEPDEGVDKGLQSFSGERGFKSDWKEGYYPDYTQCSIAHLDALSLSCIRCICKSDVQPPTCIRCTMQVDAAEPCCI